MTIEQARDRLKEELEAMQENASRILIDDDEYQERRRTFVAALEMAVQAMSEWEKNLDIEYDYNGQAKMIQKMLLHYETEDRPIRRDGVFLCPACGKRTSEWHSYCHICGKKLGWGNIPGMQPKERRKKK